MIAHRASLVTYARLNVTGPASGIQNKVGLVVRTASVTACAAAACSVALGLASGPVLTLLDGPLAR